MATFVHKGEAYMHIKEFVNILDGIRIDMEEEYKWCIDNSKVIQNDEIRNIVIKMTKDDFEMFIENLNKAKEGLQKHLISTLKVGKKVTIKEINKIDQEEDD